MTVEESLTFLATLGSVIAFPLTTLCIERLGLFVVFLKKTGFLALKNDVDGEGF